MDEVNRLYFITGFLIGVMLMGSLSVALAILYHEWLKKPDDSDGV